MFTDRYVRGLQARDEDYMGTRQRETGRLVTKVRTSGQKEFYYQYWRQGGGRCSRSAATAPAGSASREARARVEELSRLYRDVKDVRRYLDEQERLRQGAIERERQRGSLGQLLDSYLASMEANG